MPFSKSTLRFWRNTSVASLTPGEVATLPHGTLGYEWDEDLDNGFRPPGLIRLSDTVVSGVDYLQDYGSTYGPGTANHALTLYRHTSGALVFGAGTIQWSWGLDSNHDRGNEPPSLAMQQATVNLLADMSAQPLTPQAGLFISAGSTDTLAPASAITSPANNSAVPADATITITGTATDAGGGVVGAVEVSVDGGATWQRATGREAWTFAWQTGSPRTVTLVSRAVDDSGNVSPPSQAVTVTVGGGSAPCPCTIWSASAVPTNASESDFAAVELGVKFRTSVAGSITGIRFYKGAQNSGVHVGTLWSATGTLLASATFTAESAQGWQQVTFGTPVPVTANTTYVASYHAPNGGYAGDNNYFQGTGVTNGPLQALADGVDGGNGVYRYGPSGFPTETWFSTNYWVDVVFAPSVVPGPSGEAPILVITSAANPFSGYYAEIMRAEGLNAFATIDISQVTDATLAAHDVVILGEVALTTAHVTMFTNWVNNGGNLIAMRPDKKLAPLLGLTDAGTTLSDAYVLVNTAAAPGAGIAEDYTWTFTTGTTSSGTDEWTVCASEGGVCALRVECLQLATGHHRQRRRPGARDEVVECDLLAPVELHGVRSVRPPAGRRVRRHAVPRRVGVPERVVDDRVGRPRRGSGRPGDRCSDGGRDDGDDGGQDDGGGARGPRQGTGHSTLVLSPVELRQWSPRHPACLRSPSTRVSIAG